MCVCVFKCELWCLSWPACVSFVANVCVFVCVRICVCGQRERSPVFHMTKVIRVCPNGSVWSISLPGWVVGRGWVGMAVFIPND